jgi:predicted GNAT family N-acyltransferase
MSSTHLSNPQFTIKFQPPPQPYLHNYDRLLPASSQSREIPPTFLSALTVREQVFVHEQGVVPVTHHVDTDDARSCHFVIFAPSSCPSSPLSPEAVPIGTLRLIPFPHYQPHPLPNSRLEIPSNLSDITPAPASETFFKEPPEWKEDRETSLYDGKEPYIKIGRLAVVKEWRGRGVAGLLIEGACRWARAHAGWAVGGQLGNRLQEEPDECENRQWKGLICAQAQAIRQRTWERSGFAVDEGFGVFWVGDMKHVGMWRRVQVKKDRDSLILS